MLKELFPSCNINLDIKMRWYLKLLLQVSTPLVLIPFAISASPAIRAGYVVLVMAVYWSLELLPLPVTSLLPVVLFPVLGIMDTNETSTVYLKGTNMMYMGSLMMALAVEESQLHRRIALKALLLAGTKLSRIMLGFMIPTAVLSMWISNTATTAMMIPILEAVLQQLDITKEERSMMLLSVAFAANIGGTATIIGTPPNMISMDFIQQYKDQPLNFGNWIIFALPLAIINIACVWIILQLFFTGKDVFNKTEKGNKEVEMLLKEKYESLGEMRWNEKIISILFCILVTIWFLRDPGFMPGWAILSHYDPFQGRIINISSASPTILMVILLFIIPSDPAKGSSGDTLLTWPQVQSKFPWGIILLMGGGYALAAGSKKSCLTHLLGSQLISISDLPDSVVLLIICLVISVVSQVASNAATVSMFMPVILDISNRLQVNPLYFALPATLTASHAFMLPVSTPPNAIVYMAGGIRMRDMVLVGTILNIVCLLTTMIPIHTYGIPMFNLLEVPEWANVTLQSTQQC